ncbi:MAG: prefoldin subunit beta [Candidatus Woesearchaeota archaeon]
MKTEEKIRDLQESEQTLQQILIQKQTFQAQLLEIEAAQEEMKKSEEVYKFVGNILVKSKREDVEKELSEKNETILLRIKNIEKQEEKLSEKIKNLREEILRGIEQKKDKK